jgi:hypothetical protein
MAGGALMCPDSRACYPRPPPSTTTSVSISPPKWLKGIWFPPTVLAGGWSDLAESITLMTSYSLPSCGENVTSFTSAPVTHADRMIRPHQALDCLLLATRNTEGCVMDVVIRLAVSGESVAESNRMAGELAQQIKEQGIAKEVKRIKDEG